MDPISFVNKVAAVARTRGPSTAAQAAFIDVASHICQPIYARFKLGRFIWESDADVLIVLDGARTDAFREVSKRYDWLAGETTSAWSVGSSSSEWYGQTFGPYARTKWDLDDVGVITANPFSGKRAETTPGAPPNSLPLRGGQTGDELAYLDELWRCYWGVETNAGHLDIVDPEVVTHRTIDVWRRREELGVSRLVSHYMQPHAPFRSMADWFDTEVEVKDFGEPSEGGASDPWLRVRDRELPEAEFWRAYLDNFDWVLGSVEGLLDNIDAEVLITSDHGNGFGEWGVWGHPAKSIAPALRKVPWVRLQGVDNRSIQPRDYGPVTEAEASVEERLESLGYL